MGHEKKDLKQNQDSEIIVIEDSDCEVKEISKAKDTPKILKTKKKRSKHRRHVQLSKRNKDGETLIVTQEVKIKKQKVPIEVKRLHLPNTMCRCKLNERKVPKRRSFTSQCTERIVPCCMRRHCSSGRNRKSLEERSKTKDNSRTQTENIQPHNCLSPISSLNLDSSMPYEAISSDSFSIFSDDEMDTLIKRTKKRLTSIGVSQELLPYAASTPHHVENISDMDTYTLSGNETNISVHSIATVVLDTHFDIYSPTEPLNSPILCYF